MTIQQREHYWQQIMAEYQASGLSGMAYCKQQTISYHQFTYWRSKLRQADSDEPREYPGSGFARVSVADPSSSTAELTIRLPSGISITGLHGDNIDLLGSILRQL